MRWLIEAIYPRRCLGCGRRGDWLCPACRSALPRLPDGHCRRCATPLSVTTTCNACWREPPAFDSVTCGFLFDGPLRSAIHQLKYRRARHLAEPLAAVLLEAVSAPEVDAILPVPLYPSRLRQRGYNQSALLATEIADRIGRPLLASALERIRDTPTQTTLPAVERWRNVHGAFRAGEAVRGLRVLLVDDVATTTGTLRAASAALRDAGATRVEAIVLARAP